METKTITESSMLDDMESQVRRPWSCSSAPSQVTEQVGHILIHVGFLRFARGSCGSGSLLSGPISRPRDLSPELLWGRAYKRRGALPLLAEAETVEVLMQLHLPVVVGRLLANQMP